MTGAVGGPSPRRAWPAVFTWIEGWYNPRRRDKGLGQKSPINLSLIHISLHGEYRRVITMGDAELKAERERMAAQTERWNAEARSLSMALAARHAEADDSRGTNRLEDQP